MLKTATIIIFFIQANIVSSQTEICQLDSSFLDQICLDLDKGIREEVDYKGIHYNYVEQDSSGNYKVLGNLNRRNKPIGDWLFFLGDITGNGEEDWFRGSVKKGYLHGPWAYSYICVRNYDHGHDTSTYACPNI